MRHHQAEDGIHLVVDVDPTFVEATARRGLRFVTELYWSRAPEVSDPTDTVVECLTNPPAPSGILRFFADSRPNDVAHVGTVQTLGTSLCFYSERPIPRRALAAVRRWVPDIDVSRANRPDTEWSTYRRSLLPGRALEPLQASQATFRALPEREKSTARGVTHTLAFPDAASRAAFAHHVGTDRVIAWAYGTPKGQAELPADARGFALELEYAHPVAQHVLDVGIRTLVDAMEQHGGQYVGWRLVPAG